MQRLSLAIAVTSALLASGCAQQQTTMLQPGAERVSMGADPAAAGAEYVGVVSASDGDGCRGYGRMGVQALAEIELRNKALAMGGDYVQVTRAIKPGMDDAACKDNAYLMQGSVFRLPASRDSKAVAQDRGPVVLPPQEIVRDEPTAQPAAVKPREMRQIADRERIQPGEENWARRRVARYVSTYSDEGRDIVAKQARESASRAPIVSKTPVVIAPVIVPAASAPAVAAPVASVAASAPTVPAPAVAPVVEASSPVAAPAAPVATAPVVAVSAPAKPVLPAAPAPVAATPRKSETVVKLDAPKDQSLLPPPGSLRMPVPTMDSHQGGEVIMASSESSLRQVTLKPRDSSAGKAAAGLSKEERDRRLEELGRDNNLSFEEYQRRYREIMGN